MSRDLARWLQAGVGVSASRIRQIYNGVDTQIFGPFEHGSCGPSAEREPRPDEDVVTIGTVGRLDPVKNHASLLQAFRTILEHDPVLGRGLRLTIVGAGPMRAELESMSRSLGLTDRIWFAGARDDTPDQYRALDVFALPSLNEGISNTLLEAMATGVPVVAARVGGNPEIVEDGVSGLLYDPAKSDGLPSALLRYVKDPVLRRAHGAAARRRVVQNFSLETMVRQYLDLYDELLGRSADSGRT